MKWLKKLKNWWVERQIRQAEREKDFEAIEDLLRSHSHLADRFLELALNLENSADPNKARFHYLALARTAVLTSTLTDTQKEKLKSLLVRNLKGTSSKLLQNLGEDNAIDLASFTKQFLPDQYVLLLEKISDEEFQAVNEDLENDSELWLQAATKRPAFRDNAWIKLRKSTGATIACQSLPDDPSAWNQYLENLVETFSGYLKQGFTPAIAFEELRQINYLSRLLVLPPPHEFLQRIAGAFRNWPVAARIAALSLIARHPDKDWLEILMQEWLRMDGLVRGDLNDFRETNNEPERKIPPQTELEAHALILAMAACASQDSGFVDFEDEQKLLQEFKVQGEEIEEWVKQYNELINQLNSTRSGTLPTSASSAEENLVRTQAELLKNKITTAQNKYEDSYWELKKNLSVASNFRLVLTNQQQYSVGIRQSIAEGIRLLCHKSSLENSCKNQLWNLVFQAVKAEGKAGVDFRERRLLILENSCRHEVQHSLADALQWMLQIAENDQQNWDSTSTSAQAIVEFPHLAKITDLLFERLPQVISFLERYPLHLMPPEDANNTLANYRLSAIQLSLWTRYQPPENIGTVLQRQLSLNDRSQPNGMGINYRMFFHPLLAVPLLFHEYLHYGGTHHDPDRGILNETEVWMRECFFARDLFQHLAPEDDSSIPDYEREIYRAFRNAKTKNSVEHSLLLYLIEADFEDRQSFLNFNRMIYRLYGGNLTENEAEEKVKAEIAQQNKWISLENSKLTWDPSVKWPLIDDLGSPLLLQRYRSILTKRLKQRHTLEFEERDVILKEPAIIEAKNRWMAYLKRPPALKALKELQAPSVAWANVDDMQIIQDLIQDCLAVQTELDDFENRRQQISDFLSSRLSLLRQHSAEEKWMIVKCGSELVGCALWTPDEIELVFVAANWQKLGLGRRMVYELQKNSLRRWLNSRLSGGTQREYPPAIDQQPFTMDAITLPSRQIFFQRLGFHFVERKTDPIWGEIIRMRMHLEIPQNIP
jgi:hypothetical protein